MDNFDSNMNIFYKRLDRILLWPIVGLVSLVFIISVSLFFVFHLVYIPGVISSLEQVVPSAALAIVKSGYIKISTTLFVWIGVLVMTNLLLIYIVWNVKKLLAYLVENEDVVD